MGMNMRLGEIEGSIGKNQLTKLDTAIATRQRAAERFARGIEGFVGLNPPYLDPANTHVYYVFGMTLNVEQIGVPRARIVDALRAEGVPGLMVGYQNLHQLPLFSEQMTYRNNPLPYSLLSPDRAAELRVQCLPIAESLHNDSFFGINWCAFELTDGEVDFLIDAFSKVWRNLDLLKGI
jgi:dTDP-4-amino-4,6-dideoxygalactose transaminase